MKLTFTLCLSLAVLAAPALAVPLSVTVVGPDDKPLPGAKISVLEGKFPVDVKAAPRDVPGENGRFNFDWDGTFPAKGAAIPYDERRLVYVRAQAPGMATQTLILAEPSSTIHLRTGRSWSGLVRDIADQPVAGVAIELTRWTAPLSGDARTLDDDETAPDRAAFEALVGAWKMSAVTDAQGRWQLDDLPLRADANLALDDARFVKKSYDLRIAEADAPPLFVRAGATVTGVLVRPDGAPIADTIVSAGRGGYGSTRSDTRTDAQGRFALAGVEPGEVSLQFGSYSWASDANRKADYLVPALQKVRAVAGETTDVGTWKAVAGLTVTAQIVDEATKKPVEGARLNLWSSGALMVSDKQGALSGRALPEALRQGGTIGGVYANGYVQKQIPAPVFDKDSATLDLGTIALARGTELSGTVRVEGETAKTIANAPNLMLMGDGNSEWIGLRNGKTDFTTQALKPGTYQLQLENGSQKSKDWELVSPQRITVPATAPATAPATEKAPDTAATSKGAVAPIEIVLRRLAPAQPALGLVRGVVTDAQGNPLGGALVSARLRASNSSTVAETLTGSDGSFEIARSDPRSLSYFGADSVEITGIERPGYLWASQPRIETKNGATAIGNLTLKKRGAVFAGRVLDANGQGAANSWVAVLEARSYPLVQAGADGSFELADLPLEKFTLIGASEGGFGSAQTEASAAGFALTLAPNASANADREALAERALEGQIEWWNAQDYWDVLGTARVIALLERASDKESRGYGAYQFATQLAERDAAEFLRNAPALIALAGQENAPALQAKLFALRAVAGEASDRSAANAWIDGQKADKREINAESVTQLLQMAVVANKLKRDDAATWLDYAAAIAAQLKGGGDGQSEVWGGALAQLGADAMAPFAEEMKPVAEFAFWRGASLGLAKNGDVASAKSALARLEVLAQTPELKEQGEKQEWNNPARQIESARQSVALALAQTDAAGALELAPTTDRSWERIGALLVIADRAIAARDEATAKKALVQASELRNGNVEKFALAASLAQKLDAPFAAPLWASALKRAMPDKDDAFGSGSYQPSAAMWAFYHASLDAARSRVMLEREWIWRLPAAVKTKDEEYSFDVSRLSQLEIGMAAVDPARALELRDQARAQIAKPDEAATADVGLAAAILATPAQRARFGVDARF